MMVIQSEEVYTSNIELQLPGNKDLGFDDKLNFHDHTSTVSGTANRVLGLLSKYFEFFESVTL